MAFLGDPINLARWEPIRQDRHARPNKPRGGIWLSPARFDANGHLAGSAWAEFCETEDIRTGEEVVLTRVTIAPGARVVKLTDHASYAALAADVGTTTPTDPLGEPHLDWERAASRWHAIWLTDEGVTALAHTHGPLDGWDSPGMVVLTPAVLRISTESIELTLTERTPATDPAPATPPQNPEVRDFIRRARQAADELFGPSTTHTTP